MKKNICLLLGAVNLLLSTSVFSNEPLDSQLQEIVDNYLEKYASQEQFTAIGASVLIPHDKQLDLKDIKNFSAGTIGKAPFLRKVTANDLYDIGSITKSFVTVLILQLHTQQKLSIDDPLGKWLPQYAQWSKVTIRQLLNMTSGIPNYSADPAFEKRMEENLNYFWTDEELLTYAHPEKPIKINEKNLFNYSNSNYILAAMIIEKVTKDSFAHQVEQLFKQGNLKNSFYLAGPQGKEIKNQIATRLTHGYFYDESSKKLIDTFNGNLSWAAAAGAIVANTEDVAHWVQLLYRGSLIEARYREDALADMETIVSMKTGRPIPTVSEEDPTGFGLGVGAYYDKASKQKFWVYQGSTLGFRFMYFWNPCNDITTVVALNSKAGEGDPDSKLGNHIVQANLDLYQAVIKNHSELQCQL
ncbi:serine hydrolase [Legionella sp. km772]|uniref:serine hydrolase domain-containing protein n=1 Tax=Legionella sp. km772 TaxID=2498111 RepID=UPI000F8DE247|nr:serine hydrolase domain-containing protein [Legionella sp. km772]RUR11135.1 class A beta-lactamase-related serine hydrolase [Legionella sp. km772]